MKKMNVENTEAVPICEADEVHESALADAVASMPCEETVLAMTELFKSFADPTRMRILLLLSHGERCVCDLSRALGMTVSAISHQLRLLRGAHLVSYRREGKSVYYFPADAHVRMMIDAALEHAEE